MMRQDEDRRVIGRLVAPPALPAFVRPRATDRAEHVTPKNPRAEPGQSLSGTIVIDARLSAFVAVHVLPSARGEEPLHQGHAADADGILQVLAGSCSITVDRNREALVKRQYLISWRNIGRSSHSVYGLSHKRDRRRRDPLLIGVEYVPKPKPAIAADGTVLTRDCPVGLRAVRQRAARLILRSAAILGLILTGGVLARASTNPSGGLRATQPFERLCAWLRPAVPLAPGPGPQGAWSAGAVCAPPRPPTGSQPAPAPAQGISFD